MHEEEKPDSETSEHIAELQRTIARLRESFFGPSGEHTVLTPDSLRPIFEEAQKLVSRRFASAHADPSKGFIEVDGERYVLIRARALSVDFTDAIRHIYADRGQREADAVGRSLLYDLSHTLGRNDARTYHKGMGVTDPLARLSAGPVHFAYSGWALVDIKAGSNPSQDENYILFFDHPYSFEADSWVREGRSSKSPVCIMNAGYSSGWCAESYGLELTSVEVKCRARGDDTCSFIMAPSTRILDRLDETYGNEGSAANLAGLHVPHYFAQKQAEERRQQFIERVLVAQDEERRHIARELHDDLGSLLTSMKMEIRSLSEKGVEAPRSLSEKVDQCIDSVRGIARGLHPAILDDLGFVSALENYVESFGATHGLKAELEIRGLDNDDSPSHVLGIALYRIVQECLTNAARHAEATTVGVIISRARSGLRLVVEDDGKGIQDGEQVRRGLGLQSIQERVSLLRGTFSLEDTPGGGCTVVIWVPLVFESEVQP